MLAYIRKPHADLAAVILRLGLAFLFIGYGYMKVSQSQAVSAYMTYSTQQAVGWAELICGILLALGLFTRLAALVLTADMVGAIYLVTGKRDFFGMETGPHGETFTPGFEYNIIVIAACLALVALGGGLFSINHLIFRRRETGPRVAAPVSTVPPAPVVKA